MAALSQPRLCFHFVKREEQMISLILIPHISTALKKNISRPPSCSAFSKMLHDEYFIRCCLSPLPPCLCLLSLSFSVYAEQSFLFPHPGSTPPVCNILNEGQSRATMDLHISLPPSAPPLTHRLLSWPSFAYRQRSHLWWAGLSLQLSPEAPDRMAADNL